MTQTDQLRQHSGRSHRSPHNNMSNPWTTLEIRGANSHEDPEVRPSARRQRRFMHPLAVLGRFQLTRGVWLLNEDLDL